MVIEVFHKANAYVDESMRTDPKTGRWLCCVTAYIASFDSWIRAEIEWRQVLDSFNVSEFHMTDFMARQKEFKNDWPDSKRNSFMEQLCTIASERPIIGVGCAISQDDWEGGLSESSRNEWKDPYYFCLYGVLSVIRTIALTKRVSDTKTVRPIDLPAPLFFLFDNTPKFQGAAVAVYREYQQAYDSKGTLFGGIDFGSRKKYKCLQIADLLVGVTNRRFAEMTHHVEPELSKMKRPLDLLGKKPLLISFPTSDLLKQFAQFAQRSGLQA